MSHITESTVQGLVISGAKALDPITVLTQDFEPGKGRIWISCFSSAWVGYWGAMGSSSIRGFFCICDSEYLADNMAGPLRYSKGDRAYLVRVIEAVQQAFAEVKSPSVEPPKDHEVAQLVNLLTAIAKEYGQTQQIRERIAHEILPWRTR